MSQEPLLALAALEGIQNYVVMNCARGTTDEEGRVVQAASRGATQMGHARCITTRGTPLGEDAGNRFVIGGKVTRTGDQDVATRARSELIGAEAADLHVPAFA